MTDLLDRLNFADDVTEAEVTEYLHKLHNEGERNGAQLMPVDLCFRPGDLAQYKAAKAWWPSNAPKTLACPYIPMLCTGVAAHAPLLPESFMSKLTRLAANVTAWLEREGIDVANPNETGAERRARKARERQAEWRARKSGSTDPERKSLLDAKQSTYQTYMAACAERKRINAEQDEIVRSALAAYESAKAALGA